MTENAMPVRLEHFAQLMPDRIAVADDRGSVWTYAEFARLHYRLISGLSDWSVGQDAVVAVLAGNRAELPLIYEAAFRGGFYFAPINYRLKRDEVRYLLEDSKARVLFADEAHWELAAEASAGLNCTVIALDGSGGNSLAAVLTAGRDDPIPFANGGPLNYTSGTTGRPKPVYRPRSAANHRLREGLAGRLNYDPEHNRHLAVLPLHHGGGWAMTFRALSVGSTVHIVDGFHAEEVLAVIERERITSTGMVPTMFHRLLALPEQVRSRYDVSSIRSIEHAGAPTSPNLKRRMIEWFGPVLFECYAATEGAGQFTFCTSAEWLAHPGTVGQADAWDITIRDEEGNPVPAGTTGRVYLTTPSGLPPFEYRGDPGKTAAAYHHTGQFTVGDTGYLDSDGWLFLAGRTAETIISGGVNIYPAEVETVLSQHPAVRDVAVIGVPNDEWGQTVLALIEPAADFSTDVALAAELTAFCREHIANYKCPRDIRFVADLGRDANGKIRREQLRELVADTSAVRVSR